MHSFSPQLSLRKMMTKQKKVPVPTRIIAETLFCWLMVLLIRASWKALGLVCVCTCERVYAHMRETVCTLVCVCEHMCAKGENGFYSAWRNSQNLPWPFITPISKGPWGLAKASPSVASCVTYFSFSAFSLCTCMAHACHVGHVASMISRRGRGQGIVTGSQTRKGAHACPFSHCWTLPQINFLPV